MVRTHIRTKVMAILSVTTIAGYSDITNTKHDARQQLPVVLPPQTAVVFPFPTASNTGVRTSEVIRRVTSRVVTTLFWNQVGISGHKRHAHADNILGAVGTWSLSVSVAVFCRNIAYITARFIISISRIIIYLIKISKKKIWMIKMQKTSPLSITIHAQLTSILREYKIRNVKYLIVYRMFWDYLAMLQYLLGHG